MAIARITITGSTHPEFAFFTDMRLPNGRQLCSRHNTERDVTDWLDRAVRAGAKVNVQVEITDER